LLDAIKNETRIETEDEMKYHCVVELALERRYEQAYRDTTVLRNTKRHLKTWTEQYCGHHGLGEVGESAEKGRG